MLWLHHLQQRLAITRREALAILSILSLLFAGFVVQFIQQHRVPPVNRKLLLTDSLDLDALRSDSLHADSPRVADAAPGMRSSTNANGSPDAESSADAGSSSSVPSHSGSRIDLNTASAADLQTLSGIGPALAGRIIAHRKATPFTSVDELTDVRGIGPKTLAAIRSQVVIHTP